MGEMILKGIKFLFAVLLIPIVISCAINFYNHVQAYAGISTEFFIYGLWGFLLTFLFLYQFSGLYDSGQKMVGGIFRFAAPVDRFLINLIPIFTVLTLVAFFFVKKISANVTYDHYFMFFAGFSYAMHILLTAQYMQGQEISPIKPHYLMVMNIIIILSLYLVVLSLDLVYGKLTVDQFSQNVYNQAVDMYSVGFDKVTN